MSRPSGLRRPGLTEFLHFLRGLSHLSMLILALNPAANTLSLHSAFPSNSRPVSILCLNRLYRPRLARMCCVCVPLSSLQKQPGILSDKHHPLLQAAFPLHFTALQHQRCHGEVPYVRGLGAVEERYPYPLHP